MKYDINCGNHETSSLNSRLQFTLGLIFLLITNQGSVELQLEMQLEVNFFIGSFEFNSPIMRRS